jgi:aspartyl-tRNA(Asn)/glutamyl-tRNA(Gln) amidotransferase subunit C
MSVSADDVRHIAALARLRLDTDEVQRLAVQLNAILAHMDELRAVPLDGVPPFVLAARGPTPLRADDVAADPLLAPPAAAAPAWHAGFFTVPRLAAQHGGAADTDRTQP